MWMVHGALSWEKIPYYHFKVDKLVDSTVAEK